MIRPSRGIGPAAQRPTKTRAAGLSILSNAILIALKLAAGAMPWEGRIIRGSTPSGPERHAPCG